MTTKHTTMFLFKSEHLTVDRFGKDDFFGDLTGALIYFLRKGLVSASEVNMVVEFLITKPSDDALRTFLQRNFEGLIWTKFPQTKAEVL